MKTTLEKVGVMREDGKVIAVIIADDKTHIPTFYSTSRNGMEEVVDYFNDKDIKLTGKVD